MMTSAATGRALQFSRDSRSFRTLSRGTSLAIEKEDSAGSGSRHQMAPSGELFTLHRVKKP